ncbi:GTPase RsgA, partial [Streptococcus suis]
DLLDDRTEMLALKERYQAIGYAFCLDLSELLPLLAQKVTVFMGQTGVGKSTLLNKIAPELALETSAISES